MKNGFAALAVAFVLVFGSAWSVAARADAPAQRLIVKFNSKLRLQTGQPASVPHALREIAAQHGLGLMPLREVATGGQVLQLIGPRLAPPALDELLTAIGRLPGIAYAEEDRLMHRLMTPDDSRYSEQWDLFDGSGGGMNAEPAWDVTTGAGTVVAVIDTGYRPHADLAANIVGGYDFIGDTAVANDGNGRDADARDPGDWVAAGECGFGSPAYDSSWHGTHVAGTIAAVTNNGSGVAGIAHAGKVLPLRVLGKCGGYTSDIADAIVWAAGGSVSGVPSNAYPAQVLNLSLGGGGSCGSTTQAAIDSARANGATVVVAAGNENRNASNSSPANCSGVVAVAAVGPDGSRAYYSNYGSIVDVAAPGGDLSGGTADGVLSTLNSGSTTPGSDSYEYYQGTSMAAPHVAGLAALLYSVDGALTPNGVETLLTSTARAFPASCSGCGAGIIDAAAAVEAAADGGGEPPPGGGDLENGVPLTGLAGASGETQTFTIELPDGVAALQVMISGGSGDADLYVRYGAEPTTSSYDCRPYLNGNNETCTFSSPAAGTWYVMLRAYSSYSGLSLQADWDSGGGSGVCPSGYTEYSGSLSGSGASAYAPGSGGVAASAGRFLASLSGPATADFDLYLQRYSGFSWRNVDSSLAYTSSESIDYDGNAGTYRWRVYSYSGAGAYSLCTSMP